MITATLVRDLGRSSSGAAQRLYRLSEGVRVSERDPDKGKTDHVVVSAVRVLGEPETYIFASDAEGAVTCWTEMPGSYRGGLDHEQAIRDAGWEIAQEAASGAGGV